MQFTVLFVCTGNICRSPTGERLLRHRLSERLGPAMPFTVASAGTGALVGQPIYPDAARLLSGAGIDVAGFSARTLTRPMAESTNLVLAMTREHRAAVARVAPRVLPKLFTLREFARILEDNRDAWPTAADPLARAGALLTLAQLRRGSDRPVEAARDDVPDPYQRAPERYDEAWTLISAAVDVVVGAITGAAAGPTATR
ncbi:MAG: low molecular weight phosphotyrosine protein phosphatase [Frankiaceae bacterium]|nr:low molecular weight phosphotyrosine protein phosphatase [Frankiaceae bacterium]MBV9368618.1 low molecular weight phosphotyrosine protein phosphatase [Frankiales bacterium]